MGLSFKTTRKKVTVNVEWGEYSFDGLDKWSREPFLWEAEVLLEIGEKPVDPPPASGVRILCRVEESDGERLVTLRLVNDREAPKDENGRYVRHGYAMVSLFQPRITVNSEAEFSDVRSRQEVVDDPTMAILYRNSRILSLGHNTGVEWSKCGTKIWTEPIPEFEIPKMVPDDDLLDFIPSMEELSNSDSLDSALSKLDGLLDKNEEWIAKAEVTLNQDIKSGLIDSSIEELALAVEENLSTARSSLSRMRSGIQTLREDDLAREAFILSNRSINLSQTGPTGEAKRDSFSWRPFQIAFQLLNINGLISTEKTDQFWKERRDTIDLAWFPTGGGKTEAYLGLIATIGFYRRLKYPEEEKNPGVHAIMRYTLRLLTLDQSERLVRLVTAMNMVANEHPNSSIRDAHPFRVGMWVGQKSSPNKLENTGDGRDAQSIIRVLRAGSSPKTSTRAIMFDECPWCGCESIGNPHNWDLGRLRGRKTLIGRCQGEDCPYNSESGIPFTPVDEDIYNNPPSILLGTADKFVQVAYNRSSGEEIEYPANSRNLLGFDSMNRPPDLIIQDELHLLSGPLGSLAGLLETALDVAWSESCDGHTPKYVAATATIRGADRDAKLMFGRKLNIFPPPIDKASDNFFAKEKTPDEKNPGRIHVSLLAPPGKSRTVADLPTASLLQSGAELREKFGDEVADPYWTLICYYNSLRELGGMQSSLSHRISKEWIPLYSSEDGESPGPREVSDSVELTSRVPQDMLVSYKKRMDRGLGNDPTDLVATSKMFEVGIDISRLGVMAINGQPKSNSEYIQSSGRVGRKYPGWSFRC